jgi:hypothetical protein
MEIDLLFRRGYSTLRMVKEIRSLRKEPRIAQREAVRITFATAPGHSRAAVIVDKSDSGIGLRLAAPVHVGQNITVEGHDFRVVGRVRWVTKDNGFYSAGIALMKNASSESATVMPAAMSSRMA